MVIQEEKTWPPEVVRFLEENQELFDDWYGPTSEARERNRSPGDHSCGPRFPWQKHDHAILQLEALLKHHTLEAGYHCTRLTDAEIKVIRGSGLHLQNGKSLGTRLRAAAQEGFLTAQDAAELAADNQADDINRAGKIWFCFFPPRLAGESGIEGFLRYWGGEALYRSHYRHPKRGALLQRIGNACIIVVDVPIACLNDNSSLSVRIIRRYFDNRGGKISEEMDHEGYAVTDLPAHFIRGIVRFPEPEFIKLTDCNAWKSRLI